MNIALLLLAAAVLVFAAMRVASRAQSADDGEQLPGLRKVVLVHGIWDNAAKMGRMAAYLRKQGFATYTPTLAPSWGQAGLDVLAGQLAAYIEARIQPGEKFDLVGFSMGGLICRYYLQRLDGLRRVDHFITLGSPHHGSVMAYAINNPGCRQMRPGSDFVRDLNSDIATLEKIQFTSIWTPLDLIIVPSNTSRTPVGRNIPIWLAFHPLLVWSPRSIKTVAGLLKS